MVRWTTRHLTARQHANGVVGWNIVLQMPKRKRDSGVAEKMEARRRHISVGMESRGSFSPRCLLSSSSVLRCTHLNYNVTGCKRHDLNIAST